jgi:tripartite motif-containing protein 36
LVDLDFNLTTSLCHFLFSALSVPEPPIIDLSRSHVYNEGLLCWQLAEDTLATDHQVLEYRRLGAEQDGDSRWRLTDRVYGPSTVVCDLEADSLYSFRVRSCRNSLYSPYSPEVTFHTPPAPGRLQALMSHKRTDDVVFMCRGGTRDGQGERWAWAIF